MNFNMFSAKRCCTMLCRFMLSFYYALQLLSNTDGAYLGKIDLLRNILKNKADFAFHQC